MSLRKRSSSNSLGYLGRYYFNCWIFKSFPWTLYAHCPSASLIPLFLNATPALRPMTQMFLTRCWKKTSVLKWLQYSWSCLGCFFFNFYLFYSVHSVSLSSRNWMGKKSAAHMSIQCTFPVRRLTRKQTQDTLNKHASLFYCKHNKLKITLSYILMNIKKVEPRKWDHLRSSNVLHSIKYLFYEIQNLSWRYTMPQKKATYCVLR